MRSMVEDKFKINLKHSLKDELNSYVLVDDSLLLQIFSPNLDIFDMYSDFSGEPIGLSEYFLPRRPGQDLPFGMLYGVPSTKWLGFKNYIEQLLIDHNGKQYGPFFLTGKTKDVNKRGNKYPVHELIPVFVISVINYTDSKVLKPVQEKPDSEVEFVWGDYNEKGTKERRRSPISKSMRFEIYQRDGFRCHYCKIHKDEFSSGVHLTLDHKMPYSDGGDDSFENIVTACSECNEGKSNKIVKNV